jgi:large subunit ribosomal protein L17
MRHQKKGKKLKRDRDQRRLLQKNIAADLILKEKIKTTNGKAKFARPYVEKLITIAKEKDLSAKQRLHGLLSNKKAEKKLLNVLGPKYKERRGGYVRILKLKERPGDRAEVVLFELI